MGYDKRKHQEFKLRAIKAIEAGEGFDNVWNSSIYQVEETRYRWVLPPPPKGTYWAYELGMPDEIKEFYTVTVDVNYLSNIKDIYDFFTVSLINNQKDLIYKFFNAHSNTVNHKGYSTSCIKDPLFITPSCFRIFAAKNHCDEEGIYRLVIVLEQLQIIKNKLNHAQVRKPAYKLLLSIQKEILDYVYSDKPMAVNVFKENCLKHIKVADDNGFINHGIERDILANLALAILGVGVLYIAAAAINYCSTGGKHFFFHFETEDESYANELTESVMKLFN